MAEPTIDDWMYLYLGKIYDMAECEPLRTVHVSTIKDRIGINEKSFTALRMKLIKSPLLWHDFNDGVKLSGEGINMIQIHLNSTSKQLRFVMNAILLLGSKVPDKLVSFDKLQQALPKLTFPLHQFINILKEKGFLGLQIDEYLQLGPNGHRFLEGDDADRRSNIVNNIMNNTINAGDNSQNVIGNHNSQTQIISVSPEFDKAITAVLELVEKSSLLDDDKRDAINDIATISRCANNPQEAMRGFSKLEALKFLMSSSSVALKVVEYWPALEAHFTRLIEQARL